MKAAVLLAVLMTAILRGTVHDSHDGRPVRNATITVDSGSAAYTTKTDLRGEFTLFGVAPGRAILKVEAPGFAPGSIRLCVHPDETRTLPLLMSTGGSIPQLTAVSRHNQSVADGINANATSDVYYLSNC